MKITKNILWLLLLCSITATAQTTAKKEFKFGKVELSEFNIKPEGTDSAAAAIVLFDVGKLYFDVNSSTGGFMYVYERHVRTRIVNKTALSFGNFVVSLYQPTNSRKETLTSMEAATYNLIDGKIDVSKITKDAKFTENVDKNHIQKKYALANVKEGSIIEYKLRITSDFIYNIRDWDFQSSIPTIYSEYNVKIPEYLKYKTNFVGYHPYRRTIHEFENALYGRHAATALYDQYIAENVPALKEEPYVTTMDDYRLNVSFELQATQFPEEMRRDFNGTWPKIVADLLSDEQFGGYIGKSSFAKSLLPGILKGEKDTLKVAKLIYNYVKSNVKWSGSQNIYTSNTSPKAILDKKIGNAADINLILVCMMKEAGIPAYPALLSTRSNGAHSTMPILSKFNNVLALVSIGPTDYYLDATNKSMPFGMVEFDNLNHIAFYIDVKNKTGEWLVHEPVVPSMVNFVYNFKLDTDHKLTGQIYEYRKGYNALNERKKYAGATNDADFIKTKKNTRAGLELTNYKITNVNELDEILTESMDATIEENVDAAGDMVYFTPLLFERTKENIFKSEERKFPVDFGFPFKETYTITVDYPESYEIEKLPKGAIYKMKDGKTTFTINYLNEGKKLMVRSIINIDRSAYTSEEYFDLKELFKNIVSKQSEQIVFKQKS